MHIHSYTNIPGKMLYLLFLLLLRLTCRQMATFTLHPKVVLTARGESPRSLKIFEKV